ncbi:hypothetical protein CPC08DRAFT_768233 [Agrocybe pediades]|nr:hypothetical protein CPC08DRAFT_768233 [Agrocybe pediades]
MLYGGGSEDGAGRVGLNGEGSASNPIVILGCSAGTFANFMAWLNHAAWENPGIDGVQGYLDVLHMTHMWGMREGFTFAVNSLDNLGLRSAHKIHLARRYGIPKWIPVAVRLLLRFPLDDYSAEDYQHLGYATFIEISKGKDMIARTRTRCAFVPPFPLGPAAFDDAPHCSTPETCKRVWCDSWAKDMLRRILSPRTLLPLSHVVETLRAMNHTGMHSSCKEFLVKWVETQCPAGLDQEEREIRNVIAAVTDGVMENVIVD